MKRKIQEHRFTLVVKPRYELESRKMVELSILSCFAKRPPDGMEFHLLKRPPKRN